MPIRALLALVLLCPAAAPARADSFSSWSAKAAKAEKQGDPVAAVEGYSSALRLWKKSDGKKAKAKILAARAKLFSDAGSTDAALRDLSSAIKLDDKTSSYFFRRGRLRYDLGRDSEAISDFYKATHLNLEYRDAYLYRGLAYQRQGDAEFAREDFKTACRLGAKQACGKGTPAAARKSKNAGDSASASAPAGDDFEAAQGPVKPVKPKKTYKLDWQACLNGLNACVDSGAGFGECVKKASACEDDPASGCCPQACLTSYERLAGAMTVKSTGGAMPQSYEEATESEATAFRQVFTPEAKCAKWKTAIKPL